MKNKIRNIQVLVSICILILFITDTKTATTGARDSIEMCLTTVVPSLLPFLTVTTYLNTAILGSKLRGMHFVTKRLRIPAGGESVLILGLTGGYPVGAKLIGDLYRSKKISKPTAYILLGYCNNAGPAFIFGIAGVAFQLTGLAFILWFINIISAICTGILLPKPDFAEINTLQQTETSLPKSLQSSISTCVSVCGWITIFKILLSYLQKWFYNIWGGPIGISITGFLELSNGCIAAINLENTSIRFILLSAFFAFGGICVLLQTVSVTNGLGIGLYLHGKLIQTCISLMMACIFSIIFFEDCQIPFKLSLNIILLSGIVATIIAVHAKKGRNRIPVHV